MGITAFLGAALKNLPWRTLVNMAMERAPQLYQLAKERFQPEVDTPVESAVETELQGRIAHLQRLLIEQKSLNREQVEKYVLLEKRCSALEGSLFKFKLFSGILFITALILLAFLLN